MAAVISCPRCRAHVAVPDGVTSATEVRCPLCDHEFAFSDVPEEVPALIVMGQEQPVVAAAVEDLAEPTDLDVADAEIVGDLEIEDLGAADSTVDFTDFSAAPDDELDELDVEEVAVEVETADEEAADQAAADVANDQEGEGKEGEEVDIDELLDFASTDATAEQQDTAPPEAEEEKKDKDDADIDELLDFASDGDVETASDSDVDFGSDSDVDFASNSGVDFAAAGEEASGELASVRASAGEGDRAAAPKKKKSRKLPILVQLVGIVVFGVFGLFLGYVAMLWISADRVRVINDSLPFMDPVAQLLGPQNVLTTMRESGGGGSGGSGLPELRIDEDDLEAPSGTLIGDQETPGDLQPDSYDSPYEADSSAEQPSSAGAAGRLEDLFVAAAPTTSADEAATATKKAGNVYDRVANWERRIADGKISKQDAKTFKEAQKKLFKDLVDLGSQATFAPEASQSKIDTLLASVGALRSYRKLRSFGYQVVFERSATTSNAGAFVIGKVTSTASRGELSELTVEVERKGKPTRTLRVVAENAGNLAEEDQVALVGVIVSDPQNRLAGFADVDDSVVVLSRSVVAISTP